MNNRTLTFAAFCLLSLPAAAIAQAPADPPALTGNATLVSDYRFRGISQTFGGPALQGGADYNHSSGFYVGNWNSSVTTLSYPNGAGLEMDLYAGYKKSFGDVTLDVGAIQYYYHDARVVTASGDRKFNNTEAYLGASWKWLSLKVSRALSNYFGLDGAVAQAFFADRDTGAALTDRGSSRGTMYYDLSANIEVAPKLTLNLHVGRTDVAKYNELDYTDYKAGVTYDLNGWMLGAAVIGTNAAERWYFVRDGAGKTRQTGRPAAVLSIGKTF